jgi:hypothetical protein
VPQEGDIQIRLIFKLAVNVEVVLDLSFDGHGLSEFLIHGLSSAKALG